MKFSKIVPVFLLASLLFYACKKEFSIEAGDISNSAGTWEFSDSSAFYSGNIDSVSISNTGVTKELHLDGKSLDGSQDFSLVLYSDSFQVGTYKASVFQTTFDYSTPSKTIYKATQLNGEFVVNITTINNTTIEGTFSGTAVDSTGKPASINNGKFKAAFSEVITAPTSVGVLGDSVGNCKPVVINGTYTEGVAVTGENSVQVQVTVAEPGSYSISTSSVNGIMFSSTGTFNSAGVQNILLNASGTPAVAGEQTFAVRYGNSQCAFKITFVPAATASGDYFPLTLNSNWKYSRQGGTTADSTLLKVIDYSYVTPQNTYQTIARYSTLNPAVAVDSSFYRKVNAEYFENKNYRSLFGFDSDVSVEYVFLNDTAAAGSTWKSPNISGTISGVPVSGYAIMTILEKSVPVTIGFFNFPDVIKVRYDFYVANSVSPSATMERWFARNTGEIYNSLSAGSNNRINQLTDYQVF
jgi:hypothetical protein